MVVRLQTADDRFKEYQTTYSVGGIDGPPERYVALCGREWKNKPEFNEECDHIDCAIYLAKERTDEAPGIFMIFIFLGVIFLIVNQLILDQALMIMSGAAILLAFLALIDGLREGKRYDELNEYKYKNTVNGILAWKIFRDEEVARWWHFWK